MCLGHLFFRSRIESSLLGSAVKTNASDLTTKPETLNPNLGRQANGPKLLRRLKQGNDVAYV